jgi:uncharacterized protein (DUF2062 family)
MPEQALDRGASSTERQTRERQRPPVRGNGRRNGLHRLIRHRLVIPVLRARHPPAYTARGVSVGLALAMTPTVGVQMPMVFLAWLAVKRFWRDRDFSLLVALAWTWFSNLLTVPPLYYLFLVTGRLMLGRWDHVKDYQTFMAKLDGALNVEGGWLETLWRYVHNLFEQFGLPMFVGCLPWAILSGWIGYVWTLRYLRRRAARRALRRPPARLPQPATGEEG